MFDRCAITGPTLASPGAHHHIWGDECRLSSVGYGNGGEDTPGRSSEGHSSPLLFAALDLSAARGDLGDAPVKGQTLAVLATGGVKHRG